MLKDPRSNYFQLSPAILELRLYFKFLMLPVIMFILIYASMFFNVEDISHIYLGVTRLYRALLAVSLITPPLLFFMRHTYKNKRINQTIMMSSSLLFIGSVYCIRTQPLINDRQYIEAMIPQHSSSIMISRQANIRDPKVRALADSIIEIQEERIVHMKSILSTLN